MRGNSEEEEGEHCCTWRQQAFCRTSMASAVVQKAQRTVAAAAAVQPVCRTDHKQPVAESWTADDDDGACPHRSKREEGAGARWERTRTAWLGYIVRKRMWCVYKKCDKDRSSRMTW